MINCADCTTNDQTKSGSRITRLHTWPSKWPPPHSINTGVKSRPDSPFQSPWQCPIFQLWTDSICFINSPWCRVAADDQSCLESTWLLVYRSRWSVLFGVYLPLGVQQQMINLVWSLFASWCAAVDDRFLVWSNRWSYSNPGSSMLRWLKTWLLLKYKYHNKFNQALIVLSKMITDICLKHAQPWWQRLWTITLFHWLCMVQWQSQHQNFGGQVGGGARKNIRGKSKKCMWSAQKNCHIYAEIAKFGLILTHLKLFWSKLWDKKFFFLGGGMGENAPMPPVAPLLACKSLNHIIASRDICPGFMQGFWKSVQQNMHWRHCQLEIVQT